MRKGGWFFLTITLLVIIVALLKGVTGNQWYWTVGIIIGLVQVIAFIQGWLMLAGSTPLENTDENQTQRKISLVFYLIVWVVSIIFLLK